MKKLKKYENEKTWKLIFFERVLLNRDENISTKNEKTKKSGTENLISSSYRNFLLGLIFLLKTEMKEFSTKMKKTQKVSWKFYWSCNHQEYIW